MSDQTKHCPLLYMQEHTSFPDGCKCQEEKCAWFDTIINGCAILSISKTIWDLSWAAEKIRERMP
jgi:hypothetical protein